MKKRSKQSKVSIRRFVCVSILIFGISIFSSMRANAKIVSDKPPSYSSLTPHNSISITSNSGFAVFPGSGTEEDPYVIEGYIITTTDINGIYITGTTKYFTVHNCYVDASNSGIYIYNTADGTATVVNNTCNNNNDGYGIKLSYSSSSTVTHNTCSSNSYDGIYLQSSSSSTVANNTCTNNGDDGISLRYSDSSTVANNTCSNNNNQGIYLYSSDNSLVENNTCNNNNFGIVLVSSGSSTVANNTCSNNNNFGIVLSSSDCVITYNLLQENEEYGVYLTHENGVFVSSSDNNTIHHNNFVDNNLGGTSQAFNGGTNNTWYDSETLEGNYWSDWSGKGNYSIDGSADAVDLHPFNEAIEYSTVVSTTDETQVYFTFTLLIVVVPLLLTKLFSRKNDKKIKR